jgi:hypothetical protein
MAKLINRDSSASKSYTFPEQVPKIPLRPAKPTIVAKEASPDEDIVPLDQARPLDQAPISVPVPSTEPASNKRPAPDTEDVPVVKKQKVDVVEDDDSDFEIL